MTVDTDISHKISSVYREQQETRNWIYIYIVPMVWKHEYSHIPNLEFMLKIQMIYVCLSVLTHYIIGVL